MMLDEFFAEPQYSRPQKEKEALLLPQMIALTRHHIENCPAYARIVRHTAPEYEQAQGLADLPYLPAGLFKSHKLQSVPDEKVRLTLASSGTTGQAVSRIALDHETSLLQARALVAVMREAFGTKRLPLLLIDAETSVTPSAGLNARSAGLLGLMMLGQAPVFALNEDMSLRLDVVQDFLRKHGSTPFLIFGFTFMVWRYFYKAVNKLDLDCRHGILVHSGGWKKLTSEAVSNATFRRSLEAACGLTRIYNFYGMVEQTGTAFLEGEDGLLYPPAFGDVLIRDPESWQVLPTGEPGIIQVLSLVPRSYPGHSLMTEDRGIVVSVDDGRGGRMGKALHVLGRAAGAELRGCSDVHAYGVAA